MDKQGDSRSRIYSFSVGNFVKISCDQNFNHLQCIRCIHAGGNVEQLSLLVNDEDLVNAGSGDQQRSTEMKRA